MLATDDTVILETDPLITGWRLYFGQRARDPSFALADGDYLFQALLDWSGDAPRIQARICTKQHVYPLHAEAWTLDPGQRCGPGTLMVRLRFA